MDQSNADVLIREQERSSGEDGNPVQKAVEAVEKRQSQDEDAESREAPKSKRLKSVKDSKSRNISTGSMRWLIRVEDASASDRSLIDSLKRRNGVVDSVILSEKTILLHLEKDIGIEQIKIMLHPRHCEEITQLSGHQYITLSEKENKDQGSAAPATLNRRTYIRRTRPTTSYYSFTLEGNDLSRRINNMKKVLELSPIKKTLTISEPVQESIRDNVSPRAIRDIHFLDSDILIGCFSVRDKETLTSTETIAEGQVQTETERETETEAEGGMETGPEAEARTQEDDDCLDLARYYKGLIFNIKRLSRQQYRDLTRHRNVRPHIKSWLCVGPYFMNGGLPQSTDVLKDSGIITCRILEKGIGVFQFSPNRSNISPSDAARAMGAMHKSLCFQTAVTRVRDILESNKSDIIYSYGSIVYRNGWRNSTKRATRYLKFYRKNETEKMTDDDILEVLNMDRVFYRIFITKEKTYGVAKITGGQKIVPETIKSKELCFTAITCKSFDDERKGGTLDSLRTWRRGPKITDLSDIESTTFSFSDISEESVKKFASQKRINVLLADPTGKDKWHGVFMTKQAIRASNLSPKNIGKIKPLSKERYTRLVSSAGKSKKVCREDKGL
uniref:Wsv277-like protein n=1 Tax=Trachysalambria curvirostris nimavirus TaxID=2984282 RepID=A0A9C7BR58_9VIRU|nr:MAG: wsv277-like protein [Trachysalambria curvirostris nimavirus]